ncbi:hypothetical protein B5M47_02980 [candidate division CPR3 bacterium 4484_211]|uniref:Uncharacterized protein n=1 Tax=candidate division CPR3 bacterium 4484_211 TaxID=1968527 RepID=A0A1W9NXQ5_UNCC3|nr:MAG: hypothetical protein B5M47_02980 [candidate division CPR3 bacterium 4484_211]
MAVFQLSPLRFLVLPVSPILGPVLIRLARHKRHLGAPAAAGSGFFYRSTAPSALRIEVRYYKRN